VYYAQGKMESAVTQFKEGLRFLRKVRRVLRRYDARLGEVLHLYATTLIKRAQVTEAMDVADEAISARRRVLQKVSGTGAQGPLALKPAKDALADSLELSAICSAHIGCDADAATAREEAAQLRGQ
jgi:hypothetical protein